MTVAATFSVRAPRRIRAAGVSASRLRPMGVAMITAVCAVTAAVIVDGLGGTVAPLGGPIQLGWWALAPLFMLAEIAVMHVYVRSDAHTVSLNEIPLALGLAFSVPDHLILGQIAGAGLALAIHRRQPLQKLGFNLASLALSAAAAVLVFRAVLGDAQPVSPTGWLALVSGVEVASIVSALLICAVMSIARPSFTWRNAARIVIAGAVSTAATTSVAIVIVIVIWFQPVAIVMLALPLVLVFIGYRSYSAQHEHARDLGFLYACARLLSQSGEVERTIPELITLAQSKFRAHVAELMLLPGEGDDKAYRSAAVGDQPAGALRPVDLSTLDEAVIEMAVGSEGMLIRHGQRDRVLSRLLSTRDLKDALVVPLRGEIHVIGLLLIGNRTGDVNAFTTADLTLLAALGDQASIALQNGRLERSLGRLLELQRQLRAQAFEDPVTHLANRVSVLEALERSDGGSRALILLNIDGFAALNEDIGPALTDEVLISLAGRLQSLAGGGGTVGRISADEFAILLDGGPEVEGAADDMAERVHRVVAHAIPVSDGRDVTLTVSVGVALTDADSNGENGLFARAMMALARAKRRGARRTAGVPDCGRVAPVRPALAGKPLPFSELQSLRGAALQSEES